ncbi:hypothetical protein [Bacillus sp. SM2101]|uniref:hypothetical protein n=1 Tax=Bacillus sp. SM2101 TaxID=2805366 RepID=UPI001BDF1926|nr:hypothetical protein [Bacillus sp. SM2101]
MNTLLNGNVALNVSINSNMNAEKMKLYLHPDLLIGGKVTFQLANGEVLKAEVNRMNDFDLMLLDPETGIEIVDVHNYTKGENL